MYDGDTFKLDGLTFRVAIKYDEHSDSPWDNEDGHGPVSDWTSRDKAPGERVLVSDRSQKRFYDFKEAVKIARADGWGVKNSEGKSKGQIAAEAAEADYERLRRWCNDDWYYVGVIVTLLDVDGEETDECDSLWGVESDSDEYIEEVARELAEEISHRVGDKTELVTSVQIR